MMVTVRRNILTDPGSLTRYVDGVQGLKAEPFAENGQQLTTADLGIPGFSGTPAQALSTYDTFVLWHHITMMTPTPENHSSRNAAHAGPVFLPWHRLMLLLLERNIQRVLGDATFGLPYWDWAADGEKPLAQQSASLLWTATHMGGNGDPADAGTVKDGPFGETTPFRVKLFGDNENQLWAVDRPLRRRFAHISLPKREHITAALRLDYDSQDWDHDSAGFRNTLEGWLPFRDPSFPVPNLHNRVHVWIGGDMGASTSPNDPVFYLNHCNVDRVWAAWQDQPGNRAYLPTDDAPATLFRHRPSDPLLSFFPRDKDGTPWLLSEMFDLSDIYTYDSLT